MDDADLERVRNILCPLCHHSIVWHEKRKNIILCGHTSPKCSCKFETESKNYHKFIEFVRKQEGNLEFSNLFTEKYTISKEMHEGIAEAEEYLANEWIENLPKIEVETKDETESKNEPDEKVNRKRYGSYQKSELKITSKILSSRKDFQNLILNQSNFKNKELMRTSFTYSDLINSNFKGSRIIMCDFFQADLRGSDFSHAELAFSNFQFADLRNTKWKKRPFYKIQVSKQFVGVDLRGADLSNANLEGCNLSGAIVSEWTKFTDANLDNVIWINGIEFKKQSKHALTQNFASENQNEPRWLENFQYAGKHSKTRSVLTEYWKNH